MLNRVFLIGNLGSDPEVRQTRAGAKVARLRLATNRRWKDREGARHEETEWHSIVAFGRHAEIAAEYLFQGRQVFVEGRIHTRSWTDPETEETRYNTEIVCENFQMLNRPASVEPEGQAQVAGDGEEVTPPETSSVPGASEGTEQAGGKDGLVDGSAG